MMKIGVDARPLSYQLTGIGYFLKYLLDEIQKIDQQNTYYLISNTRLEYELSNQRWHKVEGKLRGKLLSSVWMQTNVPIIAHRLKIDLYWGSRHQLVLLLPSKVKTILSIYDIVHRLYPNTMALPNLIIERLLMRLSVMKASRIVTLSKSTASDLQTYFKTDSKKLSTIYPGVPTLPAEGSMGGRNQLPNRYFLFVGTLEPRKNLFKIIKAFEAIEPQKNDVYLVVVGAKGWRDRKLLGALQSSETGKRILWHGYVDRTELRPIYEQAECLLLPSLYEGFGFPILEAMACGTPVITSARASMPEVAGEAAILVNPDNVDQIAAAMRKILAEHDLKRVLIEKGYAQLKRFSWASCAGEIIQIFEGVMRV